VIFQEIGGVGFFLKYTIRWSREKLLISNGKQHLIALINVDIMMY
jgi:hypothetical protein